MNGTLLPQNGISEEQKIVPEKITLKESYTFQERANVVLEGYFPHSCYVALKPHVEIKSDARSIFITDYAAVRIYRMCAQVLVPYQKVIDLGFLPPGNYRVLVEQEQNGTFLLVGEISIRES